MEFLGGIVMKTATKDVHPCIDNCLKCYEICRKTIGYLVEKGKESHGNHIALLLNCADICQTSANFMMAGSEHHPSVCRVCAEVCEKCAEACESMEGDTLMKECAEACRECAESCHEMSR
jgi:hypothetical protein